MAFRRYTFSSKLSTLGLLAILLTGLQACGLPDESGGTTGAISGLEQDDDQIALDPTTTLDKTLIINVERINGSSLASAANVSFVSLSDQFEEVNDSDIPVHDVTRSANDSAIELQLDSNYIEQINHVIKVSFGNGEVYYSPIPYIPLAANTTTQVTVNIYTHYLMKKLFDEIPDVETLKTHQPCVENDPVANCETQPRAKQDYLAMVSNMTSQFRPTLASNLSVEQALITLDEKVDLRKHVETAVKELTRDTSPFAGGTWRNISTDLANFGNNIAPWSRYYNSTFFALSLSDTAADEGNKSATFAASNSTIVPRQELLNDETIYPRFSHNTTILEMRRDSNLFVNLPYERTTLNVKDIENNTVDRSEPINSITSAEAIDSFLSRQGHVLEGRPLLPALPGDANDVKDVFWIYEPIFGRLYQTNEYEPEDILSGDSISEDVIDFGAEPSWLVSSNYSKAENYEVLDPGTATERRGDLLEDIGLFSWEIHGVEADSSFSVANLNGKKYGVISFAQKLNSNDKIMEMFGDTMIWEAGGGIFNISQPSSHPYNHYSTFTLARHDDTSISQRSGIRGIVEATRSVFSVKTEIENPENVSQLIEEERGILKLDGGVEAPIGHATASGSYFAFSFNTTDTAADVDRGTGLIVGIELEEIVTPIFPSIDDPADEPFVYEIQGNSMTIIDDTNTLQNLSGSTLTIQGNTAGGGAVRVDCLATLELTRIYRTHTLNEQLNTVGDPRQSTLSAVTSDSCRVDNNEIEITYSDVLGQALTLKGFISHSGDGSNAAKDIPGNLLSLLWIQDNSLGLIFAGKDQNLKAELATPSSAQ